MLNHELLVSKGFKLNSYKEGKYYELTISDENIIEKVLKVTNIDFDPEYIDEVVIIQMKEDFSNKLICVSGNIWDLEANELDKVLNVL